MKENGSGWKVPMKDKRILQKEKAAMKAVNNVVFDRNSEQHRLAVVRQELRGQFT